MKTPTIANINPKPAQSAELLKTPSAVLGTSLSLIFPVILWRSSCGIDSCGGWGC